MSESISQVNITAAALLAQVSLIAIMFIGAVVLSIRAYEPAYPGRGSTSGLAWIILPCTLTTVGPLVFSSAFSEHWRPLFGGAQLPVLASSSAMLWMFIGDILWVTLLTRATGGTRHSPFAPIYFALPALAIFLRESFLRVSTYTVVVAVFFVWQLSGAWLARRPEESYAKAEVAAYGWVSVLCFALATFIGYVTRPR
jgi:hypothetical protein